MWDVPTIVAPASAPRPRGSSTIQHVLPRREGAASRPPIYRTLVITLGTRDWARDILPRGHAFDPHALAPWVMFIMCSCLVHVL